MPSRTPTTNPAGAILENSLKHSPLEYVSTLLVSFFQGLFHASSPGAYHWANDETTEIWITGDETVRAEEVGQRPAISIALGPTQFYSLGLDDMAGYDFKTGQKRKAVLVPGTLNINCISRVSAECKRLAWVCAEQLWVHRELLLGAAKFFDIGRQPAIGAVSPAGSLIASDMGDEWRVVAVTCPFQFQRTSQSTPLGKKIIQDIQVILSANAEAVRSTGTVSSDNPGVPYGTHAFRPPAFDPYASDVYGNTPSPGQYAPEVVTAPHPFNPASRVVVRASRPNVPAVKPPSMGGRRIPLPVSRVEESFSQAESKETDVRLIKV